MPKNINYNNDLVFFGIFYTIMHVGILLIPNAIFWDDWVLVGSPRDVLLDTFRQAGAFFNWTGYLHVILLSLGVGSYKFFTFILMFASGILLNSILKQNGLLTNETRIAVVLLFLVLPFNSARIALINFPYTLCYFMFFMAWRLMERSRIVALLLFFLSFNTNSMLVFYVLPVLDMMFRGGWLSSPKLLIKFAYQRLDFLLIPFIYYFVKLQLFLPYGMYEGYNSHYSLSNVPNAINAQVLESNNFDVKGTLFFIFLGCALYILRRKFQSVQEVDGMGWRLAGVMGLLGIVALAVAGLPYWILGLVPTFDEWTSRHQLLFPFGAALVITAVSFSLKQPLATIFLAIIVATSLSYGVERYYSFFIDWNKQVELVRVLSTNPDVENSDLVIFSDKTEYLNAIERKYRFYEWNGIMAEAYGNQKRFGIEPNDVMNYTSGKFDKRFVDHYKASSHQRGELTRVTLVEIRVSHDNSRPTVLSYLFPKLMLSVHPVEYKQLSGAASASLMKNINLL